MSVHGVTASSDSEQLAIPPQCVMNPLPWHHRCYIMRLTTIQSLPWQVMAAYLASQAAGGTGALPSENSSMATEAEFVAATAALAQGLYQFDIVMGGCGGQASGFGKRSGWLCVCVSIAGRRCA